MRSLRFEHLERRELLASDLWTQRGGDAGHDNYVDASLDIKRLEVAWTAEVPVSYVNWDYKDQLDVAITEDRVFRTAYHGFDGQLSEYVVSAFDRVSGKIVWETPIFTKLQRVSSPAYDSGVIYVNAAGHTAYSLHPPRYIAIDAASGQIRKELSYGNQHGSSERPTLYRGQLLGPASHSGGIHALTIPDLTQDWIVDARKYRDTNLAIANEFALAFDGEAYSLDSGRMQTITHPDADTALSLPIVGSEKIVFRTSTIRQPQNGISVFDAESFEHIWTQNFQIPLGHSRYDGHTAIGNGIVAGIKAVSASGTPQSEQGEEVLFFRDSDGKLLGSWFPPKKAFAEEVVLTNSHAIISTHQSGPYEGSNFTRIHAVDLDSFSEVWSAEFPRPHTGSGFGQAEIAIVDGLIVLSNEFQTIAFSVPGPRLDPLSDVKVDANSGAYTLQLSGISSRSGFSPIQVSAYSEDPDLIPNPNVEYTYPSSNARLQFFPRQNQVGETSIRVLVEDGGNDNDLTTKENNTVTQQSFRVTVVRADLPPTISAIEDIIVDEDAGGQTVRISGISAGANESQPLRVTAVSDALFLIEDPIVHYSSGDTAAEMIWQPLPGRFGLATINVLVEDGGLDNDLTTQDDNLAVTESFVVTIVEVNDSPTLNLLDDVVVLEDSEIQSTYLSGISAGVDESQELRVTSESLSPDLLPNPIVSYRHGSSEAELLWRPITDRHGMVFVSVTVEDGGLDNELDTPADNATLTRIFAIEITPVNDLPLLDVIDDIKVGYKDSYQYMYITGLNAGGYELQALRLTAVSDLPTLVPDPIVEFSEGDTSALLVWRPLVDRHGSVNITLTIEDAGLDNDLSTVEDNAQTSATFSITLNPHKLRLEIYETSIAENGGGTIGKVFLESEQDAEVVVELTSSDHLRLSLPQTVTIPAGANAASFSLRAIDNHRVEGNTRVVIHATSSAYTTSFSTLIVEEDDYWTWSNKVDPQDVNADGFISPLDALLIINWLNSAQNTNLPRINVKPPYFVDVNGDDFLSPIDALLVINRLNSLGEGERGPDLPGIGFEARKKLWRSAIDDYFAGY